MRKYWIFGLLVLALGGVAMLVSPRLHETSHPRPVTGKQPRVVDDTVAESVATDGNDELSPEQKAAQLEMQTNQEEYGWFVYILQHRQGCNEGNEQYCKNIKQFERQLLDRGRKIPPANETEAEFYEREMRESRQNRQSSRDSGN